MYRNPEIGHFENSHGIVMPDVVDWLDSGLAMDAQPTPITVSNAGIPAWLSTYMDPKVIQVLVTPNKAAKILGEVKKGDWITRTTTFVMVESSGEAAAYGDWSEGGNTNANAQFPSRQSFHYQTISQWGEKQLAEAGLAKIDWATRVNIASALILDKFQNNSYFFGIGGLQCYGLLNDPALPASIIPATKVAGGKTWIVGTPNEVYADIQALYGALITQSGQVIEGGLEQGAIDQNSKLVLATTSGVALALSNKNSFGLSVYDMLKSTFPNIRFEVAAQYALPAGNLVQLWCEEVEGQEAGYCSFTEKMRAHPIVFEMSSFRQKKSQGTWGSIIFLPFAVASMIGV